MRVNSYAHKQRGDSPVCLRILVRVVLLYFVFLGLMYSGR